MSSYLLAKAIRTRSTSGNARLLLLILADAADDRGVTWLTEAEMAARCNAHRRTIQRALDELVDNGLMAERHERDPIRLEIDGPLFEVDGVAFAEPDDDCCGEFGWYEGRTGSPCDDDGETVRVQINPDWLAPIEPRPYEWRQYGYAITGQDGNATVNPLHKEPPEATPVATLLQASGVDVDPLQPLYWSRPAHADDVAQLERELGMDWRAIVDVCRQYRVKAGPIRRLLALAPLVRQAMRRPA